MYDEPIIYSKLGIFYLVAFVVLAFLAWQRGEFLLIAAALGALFLGVMWSSLR